MPVQSIKPRRKKLSILWWLGIAFIVTASILVVLLFGPSPRIVVSPQTTFVTTPLRPNGLPDYEQYVLDTCRNGVTPENNAAALIWPALWPGELQPSQYAAVAKELGLKSIPFEDDALIDIHKQIRTLAEAAQKSKLQHAAEHQDPDPLNSPQDDSEWDDALIDFVTSRPWTTTELPVLAEWATDNQRPLDMLVEASKRPRCYFPSPTLLDKNDDALSAILLPGVQTVRLAASSLAARAMLELGEHHTTEAWRDLLATNRIGHLVAQGHTLVESLVGAKLSDDACDQTVTFLQDSALSAAEAQQVLRDLSTIEHFASATDSIDTMERAMYDDATIRLSRGDSGDPFSLGTQSDNPFTYLRYLRVNWNDVLRQGNEYYDRIVAAARLKDRADRNRALSKIEGDLSLLKQDLSIDALVIGAINPITRNDVVASSLIAVLLPALNSVIAAEERANTHLDLTRLAAALAVYRAEHGEYPQKIDDLVPTVLDQLPVDLYNAKPFIYQRKDDGYLLYSTGENGADDGGSNARNNVSEGRNLGELQKAIPPQTPNIPVGADDISIRVPQLPVERPRQMRINLQLDDYK